MSRTLHVYVRPESRHSLARGPVRQLVDGTPIRALWDARERGFLVRTDRVPDLLVLADQQRGWQVRIHERETPQ